MRNILTEILEKEIPSEDTILDVGVGLQPPTMELPNERTGCDIYLPYLKLTPNVISKFQFDLRKGIPIKDLSYDTVVCLDVIEHLDDKFGALLIAEMERIARKRIILITPEGFVKQIHDAYKMGADYWQTHRSGYDRSFFEDKGFRIRMMTSKSVDHPSLFKAIVAVKELDAPKNRPRESSEVSIIIPTYNRIKYLKEAILSAMMQTVQPKEIIVVHDGGKRKDEIMELCRKYNLTYLWKENGGTASALNYGIKHMKGEWFKWLSDDDYLEKDCLELLLKKASETQGKMIYSDYFRVDKDGITLSRFKEPKYQTHIGFQANLWHHYIGNGTASLIHKKVFEIVGGFDETLTMSDDYDFWLRASLIHHINFYCLNVPTANYRVHDGQMTTQKIKDSFKINKGIRSRIQNYLSKYDNLFWLSLELEVKRARKKSFIGWIKYMRKPMIGILPLQCQKQILDIWRTFSKIRA